MLTSELRQLSFVLFLRQWSTDKNLCATMVVKSLSIASLEFKKKYFGHHCNSSQLPPFRPKIWKNKEGAVSPPSFFPIEKKRSFWWKNAKIFFTFGEIRGAVDSNCTDDFLSFCFVFFLFPKISWELSGGA